MSKTSFIYKIICLDDSVTECYVGSTNDIKRRRRQHKSKCNNPNDDAYNKLLYKFIRDNNGWDNFTFRKIKTVHYDDKTELLDKERRWIERLNATLNKVVPGRTKKEYREKNKETIRAKQNERHDCPCGGKFTRASKAKHLKTEKHQTYLSSQSNTPNTSDYNSDSDSDTRCKQCGRHDDFCRCGAGDKSFWWGE